MKKLCTSTTARCAAENFERSENHEKHHYFNSRNNHLLHAVLRNQNVVRDAGIRSLRMADDLGN